MADDPKVPEPKPNPVDDLRKGLGLLFRAAKTAIDQLPTEKLEEVVSSGAREVGRAIENVATTVERELFKPKSPGDPHEPPASPGGSTAASGATDAESSVAGDSASSPSGGDAGTPPGVRVDVPDTDPPK